MTMSKIIHMLFKLSDFFCQLTMHCNHKGTKYFLHNQYNGFINVVCVRLKKCANFKEYVTSKNTNLSYYCKLISIQIHI